MSRPKMAPNATKILAASYYIEADDAERELRALLAVARAAEHACLFQLSVYRAKPGDPGTPFMERRMLDDRLEWRNNRLAQALARLRRVSAPRRTRP